MEHNMKVCLDGPAFEKFKSDFDAVLKDTLTKMVKNSIPEGSVTSKIKITLKPGPTILGCCMWPPSLSTRFPAPPPRNWTSPAPPTTHFPWKPTWKAATLF